MKKNSLPSSAASMEMLAAFVKVNIDDDLFEQEDAGNTSSQLVFDEFQVQ